MNKHAPVVVEPVKRARKPSQTARLRLLADEQAREIESQRNALAENRTEIEALRQKLTAAEALLLEFQQSTSWRVTRPLRASSAALHGGLSHAARGVAALRQQSSRIIGKAAPSQPAFRIAAKDRRATSTWSTRSFRGDVLKIFGWAFHESAAIARASLVLGDRKVPLRTGVERAEVQRVFGHDNAKLSGFRGSARIDKGGAQDIGLEFELTDDSSFEVRIKPLRRRRNVRRDLSRIIVGLDRRKLRLATGLIARPLQ